MACSSFKKIGVFLLITFSGALLFLGSCYAFCDVRGDALLQVGILGLFLGALAVPEIDDKIIKFPVTYQTFIGTGGGVLLGHLVSATTETYIFGGILGAVIRFLAHYWLESINLPC